MENGESVGVVPLVLQSYTPQHSSRSASIRLRDNHNRIAHPEGNGNFQLKRQLVDGWTHRQQSRAMRYLAIDRSIDCTARKLPVEYSIRLSTTLPKGYGGPFIQHLVVAAKEDIIMRPRLQSIYFTPRKKMDCGTNYILVAYCACLALLSICGRFGLVPLIISPHTAPIDPYRVHGGLWRRVY